MRHPVVPRLPATAAHVFVDDVETPVLRPDDAHHLTRVLRLRDGEAMTVSDGQGAWRACRFHADHIAPTAPAQRYQPPQPSVVIAFALTKGDKPELVVQKLTELGVDRIVPLVSARSVVQWDPAKAARNVERLGAVARAAAMQSRRPFLPVVDSVTTLAELARQVPGLALAHPDSGPLGDDVAAVAIGPEGGWSEQESAAVPRHVDLGPTTLRAETAALAAGVLLTALRDGRFRTE
ncbi:MAG TPA: RsmE family RNA methyltransferase [Acidimicrobiales bacterium]|nr:RsmE family RNA methyltransferase [Acidimicrobiales bacterium]